MFRSLFVLVTILKAPRDPWTYVFCQNCSVSHGPKESQSSLSGASFVKMQIGTSSKTDNEVDHYRLVLHLVDRFVPCDTGVMRPIGLPVQFT